MKDWFDLDGDGKLNSVEQAYLISTLHSNFCGEESDAAQENDFYDSDPDTDDTFGTYDPDLDDPDYDSTEEADWDDTDDEDSEDADDEDADFEEDDENEVLSEAKEKLSGLADRLLDLKAELDDIQYDLEWELKANPSDLEMEELSDTIEILSKKLDRIYDQLFDLSF